jgi:hypothetical protein
MYAFTACSAVQGSQIVVGLKPSAQFVSPTFFGLRKMLRIFLIANQKTSHTMERYTK